MIPYIHPTSATSTQQSFWLEKIQHLNFLCNKTGFNLESLLACLYKLHSPKLMGKRFYVSLSLFKYFQNLRLLSNTGQKMTFSIKDFFSKCDQIRGFLRIWSHLLKKSLMENFAFCAKQLLRSLDICISNDINKQTNKRRKEHVFFSLKLPWKLMILSVDVRHQLQF